MSTPTLTELEKQAVTAVLVHLRAHVEMTKAEAKELVAGIVLNMCRDTFSKVMGQVTSDPNVRRTHTRYKWIVPGTTRNEHL